MSLINNLKVETKSAWVDFPGIPGFRVHIGAISRELSRKLKKKATVSKISKRGYPEEVLDEKVFVNDFAEKAVLGWEGLTLEALDELMLVDIKGQDPKQEVEYSQENAASLIENSTPFDNWLNGEVFSLTTFRSEPQGTDSKKSK